MSNRIFAPQPSSTAPRSRPGLNKHNATSAEFADFRTNGQQNRNTFAKPSADLEATASCADAQLPATDFAN
eukprot:7894172-Pyramimonas_sp.AAC.1